MTRVTLRRFVCLLWILTMLGCGASGPAGSPLPPAQAVAEAKSALAIGYSIGDSASAVTQKLSLPSSGLNGSTIVWTSSDPLIITVAGAVAQPVVGDATVTLIATISVAGAATPRPSRSPSRRR